MPSGGQNKGVRSFPLTKQQIEEAYLTKDISMKEAAKTLGCGVKVLWQACKDHGIQSKSNTREIEKGRPLLHKKLGDHEWLRVQLQTRTLEDIGKELGTVGGTIGSYAKRHGLYDGNMGHSASQLWAAQKTVRIHKAAQISKEAILREYINKDVNVHQACKALGCSYPTLIEAMTFHEISPKNRLRKIMPMGAQPGEKWLSQNGYVLMYIPGYAGSLAGRVLEHRYVAEQTLGRLLESEEVVHHRNRKRNDNRRENLMVLTREEHRMIHMVEDSRRAGAWDTSVAVNLRQDIWYELIQRQHEDGQDITSYEARLARYHILHGPLTPEGS